MSEDQRVVVIGASGFGRECLDVLEAMIAAGSPVEVVGVIDDTPSPTNLERLAARGVRHLGSLAEWLKTEDESSYVLGIGNPTVRRRLVTLLDEAGRQAFTAVHPSATFGAGTILGEGTVVCAGAAISNNVRTGRHVHVNPNATIGHDTALGDFASINPGATISGECTIEEETLVGAGAVVLQQLTVGAGSVVGASACVTKPVPAGNVAVGVPARW